MKKGISIPLCVILIFISVFVTYQYTNAKNLSKYEDIITHLAEQNNTYKTIQDIDTLVDQYYLNDADKEQIENGLIMGYIYGLGDRYAYYYSPEEMLEYRQLESKGKMTGIGIRVIYDNTKGGIYITAVMPDTPAFESGMKVRDIIIGIDDEIVSEIGYNKAVNMIKDGDENTSVTLTVARAPDYIKTEKIEVTRKVINATSVFSEMIDGETGYISITEFNSITGHEIKSAVEQVMSEGAKRLLFDVRNNPGGDLVGVATGLDFLLPKGPIIHIVSKEGVEETLNSDENSIDIPMVVLINENTASAGELFCCALKDYGKAVLVGTKTFGKGSMQSIMGLPNGGGFSLTTNRYDPPYSGNYDGKGVEPDIVCELTQEQYTHFYELTFDNDPQIIAAIKAFDEFESITQKNNLYK